VGTNPEPPVPAGRCDSFGVLRYSNSEFLINEKFRIPKKYFVYTKKNGKFFV